MKYFSKYLLAVSFVISSLFIFSPSSAMRAPAGPTTLDQVGTILQEQFDTQVKEPWYKPVTGFAIGRRLSKSRVVEALGYGTATIAAGTTGYSLWSLLYAIKNDQLGALISTVGSAGSSLISQLVSWPMLYAMCPVASSVVFIKILRALYQRTARGKCLILRMQLEEELRALRVLYSGYCFDFTSGQDAESRASSLYADSTWPLVDLRERLSNSVALISGIYENVTEIERGGIEDDVIRNACAALKSATTRLSQGLLKNIDWIQRASLFKAQEQERVKYTKQLEENDQRRSDREAIVQAGGHLTYHAGATYGQRQLPVVVNAG